MKRYYSTDHRSEARKAYEHRSDLARRFATDLTLGSLNDLLEATYGAHFAAAFRLWQAREGNWVMAGNCEPIMLYCQPDFSDLIQAREGGSKRPVGVSMEAYNGGPMTLPGYQYSVVVDVAGVQGLGKSIPLLRDHDAQRIVGHGIAKADANSLRLTGQLLNDNKEADEVVSNARDGFPWQASIGLQPHAIEMVAAGESEFANGRMFEGPILIVRDGLLREVSILAMGADATTKVEVAAGGELPMLYLGGACEFGGLPNIQAAEQLVSALGGISGEAADSAEMADA